MVVVTPTSYIQPDEYASYGLAAGATTDQQVARASQLINTVCGRAKWGFAWMPDANGNAAYMAAASADITLIVAGGIGAGQNVVCQVAPGQVIPDLVGKTFTLEPGVVGKCEVVQIVGTAQLSPTSYTVTLGKVQFSHAGPAKLIGGLQIFESRYLDNRRAYIRVSQFPVVNLIGGAGRIEYGRRSDQITGAYYDNSILAVFSTASWGGAPPWLIFDVSQCGSNPSTGQLWVPVSVYLMRYSDVRMFYTAGYAADSIPAPIKQACANITLSNGTLIGTPMMNSNFKKMSAGDTMLERFKDVAIDAETSSLLEPFKANLLY